MYLVVDQGIFKNIGHPEHIKIVIIKKCLKLLRIYSNSFMPGDLFD